MATLKALIPDCEVMVQMHPSELAGYMLKVLLSQPPNERSLLNRRNFCGAAASEYSNDMRNFGPEERVAERCAVAWSWLEINWLICKHPSDNNDWYIVTEKGCDVRDRTRLAALVRSEVLPESFLHGSLLTDVRPLFLQARYDLAVFEAFHRLEVEMRRAARLGDDLVGTRLAARAFNPENGPLTDATTEAGGRQALMNLVSGALGSYRNPQSHRHVGLDATEAREMIVIASHLP